MEDKSPSGPKLSVNINKVATLRNARGTGHPRLSDAIDMIADAGSYGITIHPREDERHIKRNDIFKVSQYLREKYPHLEFNIEGDMRPQLVEDILRVHPDQATIVPVRPGEITSDHGFNFDENTDRLVEVIGKYKNAGIRVSIFVNSVSDDMPKAKKSGTDRIEIYTGPYAQASGKDRDLEFNKIKDTITAALEAGLEINAGHDLDTDNIPRLVSIGGISELSIGHMLMCHALEVGLRQSVVDFLNAINS
jgi:pyridoxine 5-phosphate synthase